MDNVRTIETAIGKVNVRKVPYATQGIKYRLPRARKWRTTRIGCWGETKDHAAEKLEKRLNEFISKVKEYSIGDISHTMAELNVWEDGREILMVDFMFA